MHTYSRGCMFASAIMEAVQTVYKELMGEKYAINVILSQAL